ncbi:MAG TPA: hypothetical protein VFE51_17165 [Verrucomicrobiae bacterium]|nr:hypothetical protein [Verrucomicrobiae bacterium]
MLSSDPNDAPNAFDAWAQGLGVSTQSFAQSGEDAAANAGAAAKPTISVTDNGGGSFTVTGSGFLPNHGVSVRATNGVQDMIFPWAQTTSDGQGGISWTSPGVCAVGQAFVFFSATDGRKPTEKDDTGDLWSNSVQMSCPPPPEPDDPDDPDDPPDPSDPPAPADPPAEQSQGSGGD